MASREVDFETLRNDVDDLRKDLAKLLKESKGNGRERMTELKHRLRSLFDDLEERAREKIGSAYTSSKDLGGKAIQRSRDEMSKRPWTVACVSLLIGLTAGLFIRRK